MEDIPDAGLSLWQWFWDIRQCQAAGFSGPTPISHQEYRAWLDLTGNIVRREEIAILKAVDARFCEEIDKESEAIREREQEST